MATTAEPISSVAAFRVARLRARVSTSPGRLRLAAIVLLLAMLVFGIGAYNAVNAGARRRWPRQTRPSRC